MTGDAERRRLKPQTESTAEVAAPLKPSCPHGYTEGDLARLFPSEERRAEFYRWMNGQTFAMCDGRVFDPQIMLTVPDAGPCHNSGGHGWVYYTWDVDRFIRGLPIID